MVMFQWIFCACLYLFALCSCDSCYNESLLFTCVDTFEQLQESTFQNSSTGNMLAILDAFYPPNKAESNIVDIYYCVACTPNDSSTAVLDKCVESYHFQWLDEEFLLPIEYELLRALTFGVADFNREQTQIIIRPFCDTANAIDYLTRFTTILKTFAQPADSDVDFIRGYALLKETNGEFANPTLHSDKAKHKINVLIVLLVFSTVVCCVALHIGRVEGSVIHSKLSHILETANISYERAIDLMSVIRKSVKNISKKTKPDLTEDNPLLSATKKNEDKSVAVKTTGDKQVLLLKIPQGTRVTTTILDNPLSYLSQASIHWCVIAFVGITIQDIINTSSVKGTIHKKEWLLSPMPVWSTVIFIINFIITSVIQVVVARLLSNKKQQPIIIRLINHTYQVVVVFCITSLPLYIIFHGVWVGVILVTFLIRTIPSLVYISFLVTGMRWLSSNIQFILNIIDEAFDNYMTAEAYRTGGKIESVKKAIKNKPSNITSDHQTAWLQKLLPKIVLECACITAIFKILSEYSNFIAHVVTQVVTLIIWVLAQLTVHTFSDTIQDVSNLSDSPITTIIGAIVASKLFSDIMEMLSPPIAKPKGVYILEDCQVKAIIHLGLEQKKCDSCNNPLIPDPILEDTTRVGASVLEDTVELPQVQEDVDSDVKIPLPSLELAGDEEGYEDTVAVQAPLTITCPHCQHMQHKPTGKQVEATVKIQSGLSEAHVVLNQQFVGDIIAQDGATAIIDNELESLKKKLLQARPFTMKLDKEQVISIARPQEEILYEPVDSDPHYYTQ